MPLLTVSQEKLREMIEEGVFGDRHSPRINIKEVLATGEVTFEYGNESSPVTVRSVLKSGESTVQFNLDRLPSIEEILNRKKK